MLVLVLVLVLAIQIVQRQLLLPPLPPLASCWWRRYRSCVQCCCGCGSLPCAVGCRSPPARSAPPPSESGTVTPARVSQQPSIRRERDTLRTRRDTIRRKPDPKRDSGGAREAVTGARRPPPTRPPPTRLGEDVGVGGIARVEPAHHGLADLPHFPQHKLRVVRPHPPQVPRQLLRGGGPWERVSGGPPAAEGRRGVLMLASDGGKTGNAAAAPGRGPAGLQISDALRWVCLFRLSVGVRVSVAWVMERDAVPPPPSGVFCYLNKYSCV